MRIKVMKVLFSFMDKALLPGNYISEKPASRSSTKPGATALLLEHLFHSSSHLVIVCFLFVFSLNVIIMKAEISIILLCFLYILSTWILRLLYSDSFTLKSGPSPAPFT